MLVCLLLLGVPVRADDEARGGGLARRRASDRRDRRPDAVRGDQRRAPDHEPDGRRGAGARARSRRGPRRRHRGAARADPERARRGRRRRTAEGRSTRAAPSASPPGRTSSASRSIGDSLASGLGRVPRARPEARARARVSPGPHLHRARAPGLLRLAGRAVGDRGQLPAGPDRRHARRERQPGVAERRRPRGDAGRHVRLAAGLRRARRGLHALGDVEGRTRGVGRAPDRQRQGAMGHRGATERRVRRVGRSASTT